MKKTVIIDSFPESAGLYRRGYAVVAVDVIRATTSIISALATGRRCFPVPSIEAARVVSARLANPLWAGEIGGDLPEGFEMNNSPSELARRTDVRRPLILLSSSGTRLVHLIRDADAAFVGCLRNYGSLAKYLGTHYERVAIIGAGSRGDFREEDQMGCAWIAGELLKLGFVPGSLRTEEIIDIWNAKPPEAIIHGKSADYLRRSRQEEDLFFILDHIDDLDCVTRVCGDEVVAIPTYPPRAVPFRKLAAGTRVQPVSVL